jgi:FG-GAP repeat protein
MTRLRLRAKGAIAILSLCACFGGDGTQGGASSEPVLRIEGGVKQLLFSWKTVPGVTHYRLFEDADGASGFTQLGGDLTGNSFAKEISVHRYDWARARYRLDACGADGCKASPVVSTAGVSAQAVGYFKPTNCSNGYEFGRSLALSAAGDTLAVGAFGESSSATGINGFQHDASVHGSGAVYVFDHIGVGSWAEQAYVKASNTGAGDQFGAAVALSADGDTLAVGAFSEASSTTGVDGNQADDSMPQAGAVYVFTRSGGAWTQQAYLKASNTSVGAAFGFAVSLSADGDTLAVGAVNEASSGAVYVFVRTGTIWAQQAFLKASNPDVNDQFGGAVSLSGDGSTLAVGAMLESSSATGVGGTQADNSMPQAGAVYVFSRTASTWAQQAYVKASNTGAGDLFGEAVVLSATGDLLVVGAPSEASSATAVNGDQADNSAPFAGAAYVFARSGSAWAQQAYLKPSNMGTRDRFGWSLALDREAETLAVGAADEFSGAGGIDTGQGDNSAPGAGAVYLFTRAGGQWAQQHYVKASNPGQFDHFGTAVALSSDAGTIAVGARDEPSAAQGVDGNQADNSAPSAGAVYLY